MGKKAKAHRAKVAKRNKRIEQKKYSAQNALNKLIEKMALKKEEENKKPHYFHFTPFLITHTACTKMYL